MINGKFHKLSRKIKTTHNKNFLLKLSKKELSIDGDSLGTYNVLSREKLCHVYNKACTFLPLKTRNTVIPIKRWNKLELKLFQVKYHKLILLTLS